MTQQSLLIYNLPVLFNILNEIKENLNFDLYQIKKEEITNVNKKTYGNFVILTNVNEKLIVSKNQIVFEDKPTKIGYLVEKINLKLHRQKFSEHSKVEIGGYNLDINSRIISNEENSLKLTEREIDIILYLKDSKQSENVENLQKKVWGHNSNLETHTVETHIYRLRKKISNKFNNSDFIKSTKLGYNIK